MKKIFLDWLEQRSPQERITLSVGAACLVALLVWASLDWAASRQKRLERSVSTLSSELAAMRLQAEEIRRLRQIPPTPAARPETLAALRATAATHALALEVQPNGQDGFNVRGHGNFGRWVEWLAQVQTEHQLRPAQVVVVAAEGGVRVEASLVYGGR
ncbi:MAG TPA: type II secretion system protein GspM [Rhodocyclaceae bacterium]|jgi:type II secretory pathway component PulM|nr:type II secretion system protein M [Betaproteobacteria bacterium]HMU99751.1 type II secretion system protein GspM [Rhodocyclaceae bacterium]HMV22435.1 type II secretion system protein GspM [Rhodocyclaceae bacterium]HNE44221.1 type II secretion system protein GspM [Rhodocyclaceae bacterium]HNM23556.1 type II secretion system protein GspM [Rhodocyclaceae bacterium]